jgi:putative transcriptional regulator
MAREWLKDIRDKRGLTQLEVAKKAGITQAYYCDIENGNKNYKVPVATAQSIATALRFKWTKFYDNQSA